MNVILLTPRDFSAPDRVTLTGRRYQHIHTVLRAKLGTPLKVGMVNGRLGTGCVISLAPGTLDLAVELTADPPPPLPVRLVLALPRPKVLHRVVAMTASLGIKELFLINAWKVERSYWSSPRLATEDLERHLLLGLEQAVDTVLPKITLRRFFREFLEQDLPVLARTSQRIIAHPGTLAPESPSGDQTLISSESGPGTKGFITLFIGPEGGFSPEETGTLAADGGRFLDLGSRILRVETAIPAAIFRVLPPADRF
jgi:RsmE family RNA methyltransferase